MTPAQKKPVLELENVSLPYHFRQRNFDHRIHPSADHSSNTGELI